VLETGDSGDNRAGDVSGPERQAYLKWLPFLVYAVVWAVTIRYMLGESFVGVEWVIAIATGGVYGVMQAITAVRYGYVAQCADYLAIPVTLTFFVIFVAFRVHAHLSRAPLDADLVTPDFLGLSVSGFGLAWMAGHGVLLGGALLLDRLTHGKLTDPSSSGRRAPSDDR
jgi:hypothetical protein